MQSLETPSIKPAQGVWTSYGSANINAPADKVWAAVRDLYAYEKWNAYTPKIEAPSGSNKINVGDRAVVHHRTDPAGKLMATPCAAIVISDEERLICWRGEPAGIPTWLLLPEKVQRVTPKGEKECLYEIFETQSGPMSYLVKWGMGMKQSSMNQGIADALKKYVESQ
jgi:hypothetical protein